MIVGQGLYGWSDALVDGSAGAGIVALSPALRQATSQIVRLRPESWRPLEHLSVVDGPTPEVPKALYGRLLWREGNGAILFRALPGVVDSKGRYAPFVSFLETDSKVASIGLLARIPEEGWLTPEWYMHRRQLSDLDVTSHESTGAVPLDDIVSTGESIMGFEKSADGWFSGSPVSLEVAEVLFSTLSLQLEVEMVQMGHGDSQLRIRFSRFRPPSSMARTRPSGEVQRALGRAAASWDVDGQPDVRDAVKALMRELRFSGVRDVGSRTSVRGRAERDTYSMALGAPAHDAVQARSLAESVSELATRELVAKWNDGNGSGAILCVLLTRELAHPGHIKASGHALAPRDCDLTSLTTLIAIVREANEGAIALGALGASGLAQSRKFRRFAVLGLADRPRELFEQVLPLWNLDADKTRESIILVFDSWASYRGLAKGERDSLREVLSASGLSSWLHRLRL